MMLEWQLVKNFYAFLVLMLVGCATPVDTPSATLEPTLTFEVTTPTNVIAPTVEPSLTLMPTETVTPTITPIPVIASNADWQIVEQVIEGAEMVLVPPGCFRMGSDADNADENERPAHEQCFDAPFWIDKYEVTNALFGSEGMIAGDDHPRDSVTLPEALDHCAAHGARLPTEAEWEYAARGPDNLIYTWGNDFIPENVTSSENAGGSSAPVGSHPDGASWVGAMDMLGNLWEWTTTIYDYTYPYDAGDGRENDADLTMLRAIRGASWDNSAAWQRTFERKEKHPTAEWYGYVGFRCVRDILP